MRTVASARAALPAWAALAVGLSGCGDAPPEDPPPPAAPRGSALIQFSIENAAGETVDCASQNLTDFRIALGGLPRTGVCGDPQEIRFDDLLPGRYPVIIDLISAGAVIRQHLDNIDVVNAETATLMHTFNVSGGTFGTGTLDIRWFIDGRDAAQNCGTFDGDRVAVRILDGPQADLSLEATCLDGQLLVEDVRQGTYRVELDLFDSTGAQVGFPAIEQRVPVNPTQTERVFLNIVTSLPTGGDLMSLWTVNSSVAPMGCANLPMTDVEVTVLTDAPGGLTVATATAACATGGLAFTGLPTGRTAEGDGLRVVYRLLDVSFGTRVLDTQVVSDVVIQPGGTSTVTANLESNPS